MKKVLLSAILLAGLAGVSFAQTGTVKAHKQTTHKVVKTNVKKEPVPMTPNKVVVAAKPHEKTASTRLKKDGTPDKRYTAHKKVN